MPELPEVETLKRSLEPGLVGNKFVGVAVHDTRLRRPVAKTVLAKNLPGSRIESLNRRGKYLLIQMPKQALVVHLGMSGSLMLQQATAPLLDHVHLTFNLENGMQLRFRDPRRFGMVALVSKAALTKFKPIACLGMEPLSAEFTASWALTCAKGSNKPIKNFLMDAHRLVGVGNIYAAESLFLAGIKPTKAAGRLKLIDWQKLVPAIVEVLTEAIAQGGTTLNDFHDAAGNSGNFQVKLHVYGRGGQPCTTCNTPIRRVVLAGRSTYWCPRCQR